MRGYHRPLTSVLVVLLALAASAGRAQTVPLTEAALATDQEREAFLKTARIVARRVAPSGVTMSIRATLADGTFTHDAHIQQVDVSKDLLAAGKASEAGFRDSYQFNIAAYRLARLLGVQNVPVSVPRDINSKPAAFTWWIDDVVMDEKTRVSRREYGATPLRTVNQLLNMQIFDELIQNRDRNRGNVLWTRDWRLWLIDHTRAFRLQRDLLKPDQLARVEGALLDRLRALREADVMSELTRDGTISEAQASAVLARRDRIVKHFDQRIARLGEAAVLFTLE